MIVCVSVNPAIDRRVRVNNLKIGEVNRADSAESFAGGKAAHVALAARALGEKVIWTGFLGGATGAEVERQLKNGGIEVRAVCIASATRINDEIIHADGTITEILEPGGAVSADECSKMIETCEAIFRDQKEEFSVVFSGSLPSGVSSDFYYDLLQTAHTVGGKTILDTSGAGLVEGIKAAPYLVKPNRSEAEKILGLEIEDEKEALEALQILKTIGGQNVCLSLGEDGLIWSNSDDKFISAKPPKVEVTSTVGCGDSTVAGFAVGLQRGLSEIQTLRLATACGAANCLAKLPGQISSENVEQLIPLVSIKAF